MLLRLPNPAARLAVLVFAFALAAILTFFAMRNARAANQAGLGTRAGYEAAERFMIPLSTLNQKIKRLGIDVRRRGRADETLTAAIGK